MRQPFTVWNYDRQRENKFNFVWLVDGVMGKGYSLMRWVEWRVANRKINS